MHFNQVSLSVLLSSLFTSHALAAIPHKTECRAVKGIVGVLAADPSASSFCSSFLDYSTATEVATTTIKLPQSIETTTETALITITPLRTTTSITAFSTIPQPQSTITDTVTSTLTLNVPSAAVVTSTISKCSPVNVDPAWTWTTDALKKVKRGTKTKTKSVPSKLTSYDNADISTACICMSIPTPTSTGYVTVSTAITRTRIVTTKVKTTVNALKTSTVTDWQSTIAPAETITEHATAWVTITPNRTAQVVTVTDSSCSAPTLCNNQGLQWAYYFDSPSGLPTPDPTYIQYYDASYGPDTIDSIGGNVEVKGPNSIYNATRYFQQEFQTINHIGYVYAQVTGTYTFMNAYTNHNLFVWVGPNAYSGWTSANANLIASYAGGSFTYEMEEGQYYPIRLIFINSYGAGGYEMEVIDPYGTNIMDSNVGGYPYLVQYSCDETTAPPFPDYT